MTSICDERGQELIYAGMPITEVFKEEMGLGGVLGLLWFQRRYSLIHYPCALLHIPSTAELPSVTTWLRITTETKEDTGHRIFK